MSKRLSSLMCWSPSPCFQLAACAIIDVRQTFVEANVVPCLSILKSRLEAKGFLRSKKVEAGLQIGFSDNVPIAHLDDALASLGCFWIVSNHDDGLVEAIIQIAKHFQDQG